MPLTEDVAIVTSSEIEQITGEAGLSRLDEGDATIANAAKQATNYLRLELRGARGIDPAKVSNTSDLKIAAALKAAWIRLVAQPDEGSQARAERLRTRYEEALRLYVFVSTDTGDEQTLADKGLPRALNQDAAPFFGPTDNRRPGATVETYWSTK